MILAEDTRTSGVLMKHFGVTVPMMSHHKFNEHNTLAPIVSRLHAGETIALVSDAGTPAISDPGFMLVRECRREGIEVETLPGPYGICSRTGELGVAMRPVCVRRFLAAEEGPGHTSAGTGLGSAHIHRV